MRQIFGVCDLVCNLKKNLKLLGTSFSEVLRVLAGGCFIDAWHFRQGLIASAAADCRKASEELPRCLYI